MDPNQSNDIVTTNPNPPPAAAAEKNTAALINAITAKDVRRIEFLLEDPTTIDIDADDGNALKTALIQRSPDIVRLLLQRGATVKTGILLWISEKNAVDIARIVLEEKARTFPDVNMLFEFTVRFLLFDWAQFLLLERGAHVIENNKMIKWAVNRKHTAIVRFLLDTGQVRDIHIDDEFLLRRSISDKSLDIALLLLEHGANIHVKDEVMLRLAIEKGEIETARFLLDYGAKLDVFGETAINYLFERSSFDAVLLLRDYGFDIHFDNEKLLRRAIENNKIRVVEFLLRRCNADVHVLAEAPVRAALILKFFDIVSVLMEFGANIHVNDENALRLAAQNGNLETVEFLLDHNADATVLENSAVRIALEKKHFDIVLVLMRHGADIHVEDEMPLQVAVQQNAKETVQFLLDHGADPNAADGLLLESACAGEFFDIVKILVERGARLDTNDYEAFRYAVQNGNVEIVRYLLSRNVIDIHIVEGTDMQAAEENGHLEMVTYLLENGANDDRQLAEIDARNIATCTEDAIQSQNNIENFLFQRQRSRETTFHIGANILAVRRTESGHPLPFEIPPRTGYNSSTWDLFVVYAIAYRPSCSSEVCFERIFEIVAAPSWRWAPFLAITSHFDRASLRLNVYDPWPRKIPILTDALTKTINLKTGDVKNAYAMGRCLDPEDSVDDEGCVMRELLLPYVLFDVDVRPPQADRLPIVPGLHYENMSRLFVAGLNTENPRESECAICTGPLQSSKFFLARRLQEYSSIHSINTDIAYVVPGCSDNIQTILNTLQEEDQTAPKYMPMRLFTCPHEYHLGCISQWYCKKTIDNRPTCPLCREPMLDFPQQRVAGLLQRVPDRVYYPASIPF